MGILIVVFKIVFVLVVVSQLTLILVDHLFFILQSNLPVDVGAGLVRLSCRDSARCRLSGCLDLYQLTVDEERSGKNRRITMPWKLISTSLQTSTMVRLLK